MDNLAAAATAAEAATDMLLLYGNVFSLNKCLNVVKFKLKLKQYNIL